MSQYTLLYPNVYLLNPFMYMYKDVNDPNCCLNPPPKILRRIPTGLFMELLKGVISVVVPLHHSRKYESRSFCPPRKGGDFRFSLPCSSAHKLTPTESITSPLLVLYTESQVYLSPKALLVIAVCDSGILGMLHRCPGQNYSMRG